MRLNLLPCLTAALLLALFGLDRQAEAAAVDRGTQISLRSGVIDTRDLPPIPARLRADPGDASGAYVLVKYPRPIAAAEHRALAAAALEIYTYLPHFTYLVRMPPGSGVDTAAVQRSTGASWIGPYHPAYKLSPAIRASAIRASAVKDGPLTAVMVHVYPDADLAAVRRQVLDLGVERIAGQGEGSFFSRLRLLATGDEIVRHREELARIPEVFWIDLEPRRVLLNDTTVWVGQSGLDGGQATPVFDRGIFGEGQIVGVLDTGVDPGMCYFRDPDLGPPPINPCDGGTAVDPAQRKLIAVDFLWDVECAGGISDSEWDTHDHGTHVAGTAAGDNLATILGHDPGDGMAPGAQLVVQDGGLEFDDCADLPGLGCPVVDLKPIFQQAYDQGVRLHSNSWGDQENGPATTYTAGSQDADQFMWDHPDFLLFFAAGNSGPGSGTVLSPSTAKSVVSVGATRRGSGADFMAGFSSCGPTDDGRFKPEITSPGSDIISAKNDGSATTENCNTRSMSGTSMATPAAAGLAALVRQYYEDGWYPSGVASPGDALPPSAALVKASLVNSAADMAGAGAIPDDCQGWGRVLLDDVLYFDGDGRRLWVRDDRLGFDLGAGGEGRGFVFEVLAAGEPLEVTLAWTDFPSTPAAAVHLVNDLDLVVAGPGGIFLGNVFAGGESAAGGSPDRLNTVEQVLLSAPLPGFYTVAVEAWNVPAGPQPFALVVTGDIATVRIFSDGFESGDTSAWQ